MSKNSGISVFLNLILINNTLSTNFGILLACDRCCVTNISLYVLLFSIFSDLIMTVSFQPTLYTNQRSGPPCCDCEQPRDRQSWQTVTLSHLPGWTKIRQLAFTCSDMTELMNLSSSATGDISILPLPIGPAPVVMSIFRARRVSPATPQDCTHSVHHPKYLQV